MKKKRTKKTVKTDTKSKGGTMVADEPAADGVLEQAPEGPVADDDATGQADADLLGDSSDDCAQNTAEGHAGSLDDGAELAAAGVDPAEPDESGDAPAEVTNESIVEAILFATDSPLPPAKIAQIMGTGDARSVRKQVQALNDRYQQTGASFRIDEIAGGFQMLTLPAYNAWLSKVNQVRRETKLTGAALETLAVVAYKQPVLRADIEAIRGVAVGEVVNRLREAGLIKIVGRAEIVGRPLLYGTTRKFLETFGLASLDDLPKVEALSPPADQTRAVDPDTLPADGPLAQGTDVNDAPTDPSADETEKVNASHS